MKSCPHIVRNCKKIRHDTTDCKKVVTPSNQIVKEGLVNQLAAAKDYRRKEAASVSRRGGGGGEVSWAPKEKEHLFPTIEDVGPSTAHTAEIPDLTELLIAEIPNSAELLIAKVSNSAQTLQILPAPDGTNLNPSGAASVM